MLNKEKDFVREIGEKLEKDLKAEEDGEDKEEGEEKTVVQYERRVVQNREDTLTGKKRIILKKKPQPGRNDPCPCESGKKYKNCCGNFTRVSRADALKNPEGKGLDEFANPNCKKCNGTGRLGFELRGDGYRQVILCDARHCAMENYYNYKMEERQKAIKEQREKEDKRNKETEELRKERAAEEEQKQAERDDAEED